ncbi:MAG: class I mannose-6-phosphate isomerase [[Lactobacillus] timonensis]|jgi:mannose-6-phosphate isomerase|uniref:type I phosphomannose isomerase catalytic subunit n=1 Tax=[Lactobacillus] timonensis TaxID=1970790 RepID=UPI002356F60E|nr:type I phosphomannose isomerase catalytic subunit [[Lactobacillus] timonensis]MCI1925394.1 class I mannose-6-phosphate isomerase [[Lactobacillus] timonensis]MCI1956854.1 class I mannose-6-phosphate isomerase [[Lactobacillus] timonensis]MCI1969844.1 class I mannose-6-phosphate isomerase [[Lactobacillus] timonensis]MCI2005943.1 class I mannose-6-phosphate isomerase [[Lactobacillus] timonensis]
MDSTPLFLKPVFHRKIWGGRNLERDFGYQIPDGKIGECWAISGHPHGVSTIKNGTYAGETLDVLYRQHPELFDHPQETKFPILTKILDANDQLSIQVHPDDEYAKKNENSLGKTECWYVLKAKPDAYLIYGHTAKSHDELDEMIEDGKWDKLLKRLPVKQGDFIFTPSGTIHALTEGIEVLETQQSSDITYRLYDYDRIGQNGKKRRLDIAKSEDVITVPFVAPHIKPQVVRDKESTVTILVGSEDSPYFTVQKLSIKTPLTEKMRARPFLLVSVVTGSGSLVIGDYSYNVIKGDHFILPVTINKWQWLGDMTLITSWPNLGKY